MITSVDTFEAERRKPSDELLKNKVDSNVRDIGRDAPSPKKPRKLPK